MALGKRKTEQQQELFVAADRLPRSPGHVFYRKLNDLLAEAAFDAWLEKLCRPYYADRIGREGIPPGTYFRMLLVGYFEGIGSPPTWLGILDILNLAEGRPQPDRFFLDLKPAPSLSFVQ